MIPNSHQYILVPKTILETIGYTAKTRKVHLLQLPSKPEIVTTDCVRSLAEGSHVVNQDFFKV